MRLHRERDRKGGDEKKERVLVHAPTEGPRKARVHRMGERARVGALCLMDEHKACYGLVERNDS